jgi:hypothetical protein
MTGYGIQASEVIQVSSQEELSRTTAIYVSQGFQVLVQSPTSVSLIKRKEFNIVYAVLGFLLCTIPLFIYLIYYANQKDRVVEIRFAHPSPGITARPPEPTGSAVLEGRPPSGAGIVPPQLSPDGTHWWDGTQWRQVSS